jgi:hypothetical protein
MSKKKQQAIKKLFSKEEIIALTASLTEFDLRQKAEAKHIVPAPKRLKRNQVRVQDRVFDFEVIYCFGVCVIDQRIKLVIRQEIAREICKKAGVKFSLQVGRKIANVMGMKGRPYRIEMPEGDFSWADDAYNVNWFIREATEDLHV